MPGQKDPAGQGGEFGPAITGFFGMEHGHGPTHGFFAEVNAGFDGPKMLTSPPDGFNVEKRCSREAVRTI